VKTVYTRIRGTVRSYVYHIIYVSSEHNQVTVQYRQFIIINCVSEHQLSPALDTSYTTPTTRANRVSMLLKQIGWRHCAYFRWVLYISETMVQMSGAEPGPTAR